MTLNELDPNVAAAARPMRVCVVGAGYVGLTAAACLAELGHTVRCVETDPAKLATLSAGGMPIHEPGLSELVANHRGSGRLTFTSDVVEAMEDTAVALLCVATPPRLDGEPDLRQLGHAAIEVVIAANSDVVLVVKSTVPPGSCEALELLVGGYTADGQRVSVVSNPEFLRESEAVWDFFNPDRVVIGAGRADVGELIAQLYPARWPLLVCDRRSAELIKYASNTFLAMKISFANEVAALAEALGAEAGNVLAGVGLDGRIGGAFLTPGPGFGGSCLPKDLSGFIAVADSVNQPAFLARATQRVNDGAREALVNKLEATLGCLSGRQIGVLGLAFKPGTNDVRHSPAVGLAEALVARGATVRAHDPVASVSGTLFEQVVDPYDAASGADALVVATAWPVYRRLAPKRLREVMGGTIVLDAADALDAHTFAAVGFDVYGVGRGLPTLFAPVLWRPLEWMVDTGAVDTLVTQ